MMLPRGADDDSRDFGFHHERTTLAAERLDSGRALSELGLWVKGRKPRGIHEAALP